MNNVVSNFPQIMEFARSYGLPLPNKRAILREYLQTKILDIIYRQNISKNVIFIGGTSLRLLKGLPRFSEDLDFDLSGISPKLIIPLMENLVNKLIKENINVRLYKNKTAKRYYFELRFIDLLYQLKLSNNLDEKLTIKLDFENQWKNHSPEVTPLKRYGYLTNVVTVPLGQILIQKLHAYINRRQTLSRDIFDIVWLYSQEATPDWQFACKNNISKEILNKVTKKYNKEKASLPTLQKRLLPFLINEDDKNKMLFFNQLIE